MVDSDDNTFSETDIPYMVEPNTLKLNLKYLITIIIGVSLHKSGKNK